MPVARPGPSLGDLSNEADVEELVRCFYGDVAQDALLGPMFNDVAGVDWSAHIPKLAGFWKRAIFGTPGYAGNPFQKHLEIHSISPFTDAHFARWLELFVETIDLRWSGPNVEQAKTLARNVARVHAEQLPLRTPNVDDPPQVER